MKPIVKKIVISLAMGSLLSGLMLGAIGPMTTIAEGTPSKVIIASGVDPVNSGQMQTLKPLWSVVTDEYQQQGGAWQHRTAIYHNKGIVATIASGQLVAMQSSSGKRLWKYGGHLASYVYSDSYGFYVITKGGQLTAVSPAGKKRWSAAIETFNSGDKIIDLGNLIGVVQGSTIRTFRASNGELKWTMKDAGAPILDYFLFNSALIGGRSGDGGLSTLDVIAFDWLTGKFLWKSPGHELPGYSISEYLYSREVDIPFNLDAEERTVTIHGMDSQTGKIGETHIFKHHVSQQGTKAAGIFYPRVVWHDNWLYIFWGDVIEGYDILSGGWDSPTKRLTQPIDTEPTGIIAYGSFQMRNMESGDLSIVRIDGGQHVTWPSAGKVLEAESLGRGLYELHMGGLLRAVDQRSGKEIFRANTGMKSFAGPVLRVGPYIIVQKEGSLQGFLLPQQLL